ncbi:YfcC family protein [Streptococcus pneumoniae]
MSEKVKKGFKMPSSYTVLMLIIALMAMLTWVVPAGRYVDNGSGKSEYAQVEKSPQGAYDVLMAPVNAMLGKDTVINEGEKDEYTIHTDGAIQVSFFIIMVGAFLGVVTETGALDVGIASIVKRFKGREKMLIPVLMPLFALGGSTYGMGEETMAFYPLLVPVMMAVGFDSITAVSIILIGSQIGCLASTVNPFATGVASDSAGISVADGMLLRFIMLIVLLVVAIYFVYSYASKIEKDPTKSLVYKQREEDLKAFKVTETNAELSPAQKRVLWVFVATFVIMIISLIPWGDFGIPLFENINNMITGLPVIGQIFGHSAALGTWYFPEVTMLFIFMAVLVGLVYGMAEDRFISAFMAGAADLLGVALICAVARGIQVIMNDGQISGTILHWGEGILSGFSSQVFIVLTYIFYLPMSFLIPSSSGLAGATMGIIAPLGEFANVKASLIVTAFQSANGVLNLLAPTSGIVMGALALGRIELGTWLKYVGKFVAIVIAISIAFLVLGTFLPF